MTRHRAMGGREESREGGHELVSLPCWGTLRGTHIPVDSLWEGPILQAFFFFF